MSKPIIKFLLIIVVAFIVIVTLFNVNIYLGILAAGIAFLVYTFRASIFIIRGNIKYSTGDTAKALTYYEKAYKTGKCKPNVLISYAYLLLRSGDIERADKLLESVLAMNLKSDEKMVAKSNLALVLWKKGNIDEAATVLEEVFENYKNTNIYGSLGYMLILKGNLDKALKFNLEAYEYNNSNGVILDNLAQTYYLRGEFEKSEEIYSKLLESKPTTPAIYYNYGLLLSDKGEPEKALEFMRKALEYKINFLSGVTEEEIRSKIEQIEKSFTSKNKNSMATPPEENS